MIDGQVTNVSETQTLTFTGESAVYGAGTAISTLGALAIENSQLELDAITIGNDSVGGTTASNPSLAVDRSTITLTNGGLTVAEGNAVISESTINGDVIAANNGTTPATSKGSGYIKIQKGSTINGMVETSFESQVDIENSSIKSAGGTGPAVWVNGGGTVNVSSGSHIEGNTAVQIDGVSESPPGSIHIDNSEVVSTGTAAINVGAGSATNVTNIDVSNHSILTGANGQLLNVDKQWLGTVNFTADNVDLQGNIYADSTATLNVKMQNHGNVTGAMNGVDSLAIENSTWTLTGDSDAQSIIGTNGVIHAGANQITAGALTGNGAITSDLSKVSHAPAVQLSGDMSGMWQVNVTDTQHNYENGELQSNYVVVKVDGTNTAVVQGKSDIGAYSYTSKIDESGNVVASQDTTDGPSPPDDNGGGGSGGGTPKPVLNSGATAAVDAMSVAATRAIWDTQFSALHLRQQNLRDFAPTSGSFWAQAYGGDYKLDNGYGSGMADQFDTRVEGLSIGVDTVLSHSDEATVYGGVYASFVDEQRDANESRGDAHGYSFGAYGTWMHRSGWYLEGMLAYGNFENSYSARYYGDPSVSMVNANDWRNSSGAIALEVGRAFSLADGWTVQPAVGLRYLRQGSQRFTTDLGHEVWADSVGSTGANASVTFSKTFHDDNTEYKPYLRVGYANEFGGTQTVHYAGASIDTPLDASRGFVNVGLAAEIAKRHAVFVDYQYQKGHNVENTYLVNVGYRYNF